MAWRYIAVLIALLSLDFNSILVVGENGPKIVFSDVVRLLNNRQKLMKLAPDNENAILIVGNTGSGKSSLTHFIAGDLSKLKAVPTTDDPYTTEYLIEDTDSRISDRNSTTISKTIVPELFIDHDSKVWYDCLGFSDTRNTSVEIATTYFVKSVIDRTQNVKLVFAVNHASVTRGYDRIDFDKMIKHGSKLLKNIDAYKLSVALVVTKVNSVTVIGRKIVQIPEWSIVKSVGQFLTEYKQSLEATGGTETQRKLVTALLKQSKEGNYTQIGVFWRPEEPGPHWSLRQNEAYGQCEEIIAQLSLGQNQLYKSERRRFRLYFIRQS